MGMKKAWHEQIHWYVMAALNSARPIPVKEPLILWVLQKCQIQCDAAELERELYYLEDRKLVILKQSEGALRTAELTDRGVEMIQRAWEECRVGVTLAPKGKS